jgi:hypothetical protein
MLCRGPVSTAKPPLSIVRFCIRSRCVSARLVEHGDELGGVTVGLRLGRGGALVDERAAGERVGECREAEAASIAIKPEKHRDASAQAERTAIGHGDSVTRPRQTARIA